MASNKSELYSIAQILCKHREELAKYPEEFHSILSNLKKAAVEDEDGMSIVDHPDESGEDEDDADKWLKEQGSQKEGQPAERKQYTKDWQPRSDYSPKEQAALKQLMDQGYSHREASRIAGTHKEPSDFRSALKSGISPSMMSDKMRGDLKPLAKQWLEEHDRQEKAKADPESNTVKRQSGQLAAAYDKHMGGFQNEYDKFLNSDAVKGLKGKARHQAVTKWQQDWEDQNPQHKQGQAEVSSAAKQFAYDQSKAKQTVADKHQHIMSGGQSSGETMSAQEALQHLGGGKTEEGYQGTITQDPSASFAARNPQLHAAMKPEQLERKKRVDSAAATQGVIRRRKGETE